MFSSQLALEKEELRIHLLASKDAQRQLTAELNEVTERNAECLEMFHESQEEIRDLRNRSSPFFGMRRHMVHGLYPMDSLAAEIEGTMRREMSFDEESAFEDQRVSQKRVFQTVRSLNTAASSRPPPAGPPIPGSGSSLVMTSQPFCSPEEVTMGRPGAPGGNDLAKALHRLSLRRHNFLCERQFFQSEREKLRTAGGDGDTCSSPMGSLFSSFSNLSELSSSSSLFKTFLPEKLQIVKPMEGSLTLHHWQQLAKPHLATILDPHPGIVTKGFRPLTRDMEEDQDQDRSASVVEKGATEQGKDQEEQEEEEAGITFKVRSDRRERKPPVCPLPVPPLSLNVPKTNLQAENQSAPSIPAPSSQWNNDTLTTSAASGE
uniref:Trafficking kinesin-binding protein C-terminal domain-containing protein n=1 Tax=Knipowitschia caucasica TaxID=637954 RepID=A0AAV2LBU0_KNICA